jgi:hypothetical protein
VQQFEHSSSDCDRRPARFALLKQTSSVGLAVTISLLGTDGLSSHAGAVSATASHIAAKPNNLLVDGKTTFAGTGFPANTKLTIKECPNTNWIVPQNPCVKHNSISALTDGHGRFTRQVRVELCGGKRSPIVTSQICYIGDPHPEGRDTITLLGAAKVTVTSP